MEQSKLYSIMLVDISGYKYYYTDVYYNTIRVDETSITFEDSNGFSYGFVLRNLKFYMMTEGEFEE